MYSTIYLLIKKISNKIFIFWKFCIFFSSKNDICKYWWIIEFLNSRQFSFILVLAQKNMWTNQRIFRPDISGSMKLPRKVFICNFLLKRLSCILEYWPFDRLQTKWQKKSFAVFLFVTFSSSNDKIEKIALHANVKELKTIGVFRTL